MSKTVDFGGRPFHFIGIGGIGMSALAYILTKRKFPVSGSDLRLTHITQRLQEAGAHIFWQQEASNLSYFQTLSSQSQYPWSAVGTNAAPSAPMIQWLPQVICSTAIDTSNPEYQAALQLGCPIFHRSELLAALIEDYRSIAVAGTHGKTTTSSMVGLLLLDAGLDPTIVVGGEVSAWEGNARLGYGQHLVAEADESDGSLAKLSASIGVITNIELDHTDHYQSLDDVIATFKTFAQKCDLLVGCIDCATVRDAIRPSITYSLHPESGADYVADDITYHASGTQATICEKGQPLGILNLQVLGQHNLSNALAAIAVGRALGLSFAQIADGLGHFEGASRRFEQKGHHGGIRFIDDYAHHPSEIRATLAAARLKLKDVSYSGAVKRIVAVFQPHRYSRTAAFLPEFANAFADADRVIVTDIYSAGEVNSFGICGRQVANEIAARHDHTEYQDTLASVQEALTDTLEPGDLVLFLGAGNLNQVIPNVMAYYADSEAQPLQQACR
ncbi:MAG: UDP-N-acetylmuramate--L-alanine ligase [Cyanobacteria bacterium Co-bin8]|nr:UDP-N-acetylmuramate--L-alanine ligase [Cyanobacteria bacterium Co-bin8]